MARVPGYLDLFVDLYWSSSAYRGMGMCASLEELSQK
jgi:hypothetical protein